MSGKQEITSLYLRTNPGEVVIVLEDLDFRWTKKQLDKMERLWKEGKSFNHICNKFYERDRDEVSFALMHLARQDIISSRKGGLQGERKKK